MLNPVAFSSLGFSLLNACLRVSQQRNEVRMKQKPTCYAGGVKSLYRKHLSVTIELFSHYCKKGKVFYGE